MKAWYATDRVLLYPPGMPALVRVVVFCRHPLQPPVEVLDHVEPLNTVGVENDRRPQPCDYLDDGQSVGRGKGFRSFTSTSFLEYSVFKNFQIFKFTP